MPRTLIVASAVNSVRPSQVCYTLSVHICLQHISRGAERRAVHLRQLRLVNRYVVFGHN